MEQITKSPLFLLTVCWSIVCAAIPVTAQQPSTPTSQELEIPCGSLPLGSGLPTGVKGMVDRFNYPWHPSPQLIAIQEQKRKESFFSSTCYGFRVDFEDVITGTKVGFDDPTPINHPILGSTTLGEVRQRTFCEVLGYLTTVITIKGSPDIIVRTSQTDGSGFLAAAGPFFLNGSSAQFVGGTLYDHITTGIDPTPDAGWYDAQVTYDFGPWRIGGRDYPINSDWNQLAGSRLDLYSVTLHELTHALGFLSLISPDGSSSIGRAYSLLDKRMLTGSQVAMIEPSTVQFQGTQSDILSNALIFEGERCKDPNPVYSPPSFQPGSSLSHFDFYRSGIRYVMRPSTAGGDDRVLTEPELQVLCEFGYDMKGSICAGCSPKGVDDFSNTKPNVEVCIDVLANDSSPDGSALSIDPNTISILTGGGTVQIIGDKLCYTPSPSFIGVARLRYAPTNGRRTAPPANVFINVAETTTLTQRKDTYIWYFGENAGIAFTTGTPIPLNDGQSNSLEGTATVCDRNTGQLLFYTDGVTIWNAKHQIMQNGRDIQGHSSSTQAALIIPIPEDSSQYYVFTTGAINSSLVDEVKGFHYSIVDMRGNGGLGAVVKKNIMLFENSTEKLTATKHCNGRDYWVVTHEWGNSNFRAYLVSPQGISDPVISSIGIDYPLDNNRLISSAYCAGMIKLSPMGTKLAAANWRGKVLELFDFDKSTGSVSNGLQLDIPSAIQYSVAFSPDNTKLYAESLDPMRLYQFDISNPDLSAINDSKQTIALPADVVSGGGLQLGPDGKIYAAFASRNILGVIHRPNEKAPNCNYIHDGLALGRTVNYGLSYCIDSDLFGTTIDTSQLRISKRVNNSEPHYGDTITYTIQICNVSCSNVTDVILEDVLPEGLIYVDGFSKYPYHTFDTIIAGDCRSISLRAIVGSSLPLDFSIVNCAGILSSSPKHGFIPLDSNCATIILHGTDIAVEKNVDKPRVHVGEVVHYTIRIINKGPNDAQNLIIRDVLPQGLTYQNHTINEPSASYNPSTGIFHIPSLSIGSNVLLSIECRVNSEGVILNCAELINSDITDLDITNNRSCKPILSDSCNYLIKFSMDTTRNWLGNSFIFPISLDYLPENEEINSIKIYFSYPQHLLRLLNGNDIVNITQGTLLSNWISSYQKNVLGEYEISLSAPLGYSLKTTGVILNPKFQSYLGNAASADINLNIDLSEHKCAVIESTGGRVVFDSICGLSHRLIEPINGSYALDQNRPNPAAKAVTINFSLGLDGPTTLEIFNSFGSHVATLVDGYLPVGQYSVQWDTDTQNNGIYYYRLKSGDWSQMRAMMILK